jgi:hypothetical protein
MALLLGVLGTVALAADAEASIYWGSYDRVEAIGIAKLDGRGIDHHYITRLDEPSDNLAAAPDRFAVDDTYLYWAMGGDHYIGRARVDGTGVSRDFIIVPDYLVDIAANAHNVYWVSKDEAGDSWTISRANLDGSGIDLDFMKIPGVAAVAVDDSHVYWADELAIGRAKLDGTDARPGFIPADRARDLVVDGRYIYWTQTHRTEPEGIGRATLDGTAVNPHFVDPGANVESVAVDDDHIYWVNKTPGDWLVDSGETIGRANLDGTGLEPTFITTLGRTRGIAVDSRTFPVTKLRKGSFNHRRHRFPFTFSSDEPNSTFECRVDRKPFTACRSPQVLKLRRRGFHSFRVRAIDAAGNVDPTPAKRQFWVW